MPKAVNAENVMKVGSSTPATRSQVCQQRNVDRFDPEEVTKAVLDTASGPSSADGAAGLHPIISIGASTDAILNRFGSSDQIIPHLRVLVTTVCSSRWEAMLRDPPWNLNYI